MGRIGLFQRNCRGHRRPVKLLVHHIFEWTKLASPFYSDLNAYLIHGHHQVKGFIEALFGEMGDMAMGAIFGVVLGVWLARSHPRYHWWIGLGYGFGIWFISLAFGNLLKIIKPDQTTDWSLFAHFLAMIAFGLLFVLATRIWRPLRKRIILNN